MLVVLVIPLQIPHAQLTAVHALTLLIITLFVMGKVMLVAAVLLLKEIPLVTAIQNMVALGMAGVEFIIRVFLKGILLVMVIMPARAKG